MRIACFFISILVSSIAWAQAIVPYVISTVAGTYSLGDGGPATAAMLEFPNSIALDKDGSIYVAETYSNRIRRITAAGIISTFALVRAVDIKLDGQGNLYAVDGVNSVARIAKDGVVKPFAGGTTGFGGDGGAATAARLSSPKGIAVDAAGNVYISDTENHRIRKVTTDGIIKTIAGTSLLGFSGDGKPAVGAQLNSPVGIASDGPGNLYVADQSNYRVRKISVTGIISTIAGDGSPGNTGNGGAATMARINSVAGMNIDANGNVYFTDTGVSTVRMVTPGGLIRLVAGNGTYGGNGDGGPAASAQLANPTGVAIDASNSVYIADKDNHRIRKVDPAINKMSTIAGATHFSGDGGQAAGAIMHYPFGVLVDRSGSILVSDTFNHRIRKISVAGVITTIAGTGERGTTGDGGPAVLATLRYPQYLTQDAAGNTYFSDNANSVVRKINSTGTISRFAGRFQGFSGDGGQADATDFGSIDGLAADAQGNVYISDGKNNRVRKVNPNGVVSTFAGSGSGGFDGDGGLASAAQLLNPTSIAVGPEGSLYIADYLNNRIRKVSAAGIITTFAGTGVNGYSREGGQASATDMGTPDALTFDNAGNLFLAQQRYALIRMISPAGIVSRAAGNNTYGFSGDGGPATNAAVTYTTTMAANSSTGDIYIADQSNHRIRKLASNAPFKLELVSGDGQTGFAGRSLPQFLLVRVTGRALIAVAGVAVTFKVTSGSATLIGTNIGTTVVSDTDQTGLASVRVNLGNTSGTVTVAATVGTLPAVEFTIDVTASPNPVVPAGAIVGAGGSVPPVESVAPNGLITIYGSNFAPTGTARSVAPADYVNGKVPTKLAGTCVQVGRLLAPVFQVYPTQLTVQVPGVTTGTNVSVTVSRNCGDANEERSVRQAVTVKSAAPEFFYFTLSADGRNPIAAQNSVTGDRIGAEFTPAKPGDYLTLYGTGFGLTAPAFDAGQVPGGIASTVGKAQVTFGGQTLPDAAVLYAGVTPGSPGLNQLNIQVPVDTPDGDYAITLSIAGNPSPVGGYITVKR